MNRTKLNSDVMETLGITEPLEESIFLQMEKIDALCRMRSAVDSGEVAMSRRTFSYFSLVVEQELSALRKLLDQAFP